MKYFASILFFLLAAHLRASELTGHVVDSLTGEVLVGAHVMLESNWRIGVQTGTDGRFVLSVPDSLLGEHALIVSYVGYEEKRVAPGDEPAVTIRLKPSNDLMDAVTISGEALVAEEFAVDKIERLEIYKNPAANADALLAVHSLPASTTLDESASISFRGGSPAQTGVFFNNVPVYDAGRFSQLNGIGTFSIFNTELVDHVLVFPGNPPLEYGNVSSGLIAIESRDRIPDISTTSLSLSLANIGLNHTARIGSGTGLTLYANYQPSAALVALNAGALEQINCFGSLDLGVHLVHHRPDGGCLKVFNYTLSEYHRVGFNAPSFSGQYRQARRNNMTIANFSQPFGNGSLRIDAGYTVNDGDIGFSEARINMRARHLYTAIGYRREKKRSSLHAGISYDGMFRHFDGTVPKYEYALGERHPYVSVQTHTRRMQLEPFATYKYRPSDMISFAYAMRTNIPVDDGPTYLSHQSNIRFDPDGPHKFKFSRGVQHQLLLPREGSLPVLYRSAQVSLNHTFERKQFRNTNALFRKKIEYDARKDIVYGLETSVRYDFKPASFVELSYTGLEVQSTNGDLPVDSPFDLDYFVRFNGQWTFAHFWTMGLRGLFRQGSQYDPIRYAIYDHSLEVFRPVYAGPGDRRRLPPYNTVDLNLSRLVPLGPKTAVVVFGSVSNLFNFGNVRGYTFNPDYTERVEEHFSRRTVYFGVQLHFL